MNVRAAPPRTANARPTTGVHAVPAPPKRQPKDARQRAAEIAAILDLLGRAPQEFDFLQTMRRIEALYRDRPDRPRFGAATKPGEEPIRLGQEPELVFAPRTIQGVRPGSNGVPPRIMVAFLGLFGPNGPLPLHLTEYARDRQRNADDPTMARFADVFHHRLLMLFYRSWAAGQPTVSHDDPATDRFVLYAGALAGMGLPSMRNRDDFPDSAKMFYGGRLAAQSKNPEGLEAMIGDFFRMPTRIQGFMGDWLALPVEHRWALGNPARGGLLGSSTTLGGHVWARQQKFRVVMGPLTQTQFQRMLPGGASLKKLAAMVRSYTGDELRWDLRLILEEQTEHPWYLGTSRLGWTSWAGRPGVTGRGRREDLILDPQAENVKAV